MKRRPIRTVLGLPDRVDKANRCSAPSCKAVVYELSGSHRLCWFHTNEHMDAMANARAERQSPYGIAVVAQPDPPRRSSLGRWFGVD